MLAWSRYVPAVFRDSRMLELMAAGQQVNLLIIQESRAASRPPCDNCFGTARNARRQPTYWNGAGTDG